MESVFHSNVFSPQECESALLSPTSAASVSVSYEGETVTADMDVITLSSDSEDSGSDVEITGSFINASGRADILPLSTVRVEVDAVKVSVPGVS